MAIVCIPLQERPVLKSTVLTPEQANVKWPTPAQVTNNLNEIFNTSLAIDHSPLQRLLDSFISRGLDFGSIYARIRTSWPKGVDDRDKSNVSLEETLVNRISSIEAYGGICELLREGSIEGPTMNAPSGIFPRRLWDLHANRVIPSHYSFKHNEVIDQLWAISHVWTSEMDGLEGRLDSPVNDHEWPVPIPRGLTLEAVRTELLNMTAEYVWLDVLCLRQKSLDPAKEERVGNRCTNNWLRFRLLCCSGRLVHERAWASI